MTRDDLTPNPTLLKMAAPLVVSFLMRAAFTFVDMAYAATIGDAAVAAIGLTFPFEFLMIAIWVGLSNGLTSALSRTMAAGEGRKIEQYLGATWNLVKIVSPIFLLLGLTIGFLLPGFGLEEAVYRNTRIYAGVLIGGSAFTSFWSIIPDSIVKAHQDTRSTMWAGIISNVINVALNTFFLFVLDWGIFGIALSTVLGRIGGLSYALIQAKRHETLRKARGGDDREGTDSTPYRTIFSLAIPASLIFILSSVEMGVVNALLIGLEEATAAIATFSIYQRVGMLALTPIIATSVAMLPYAGKCFGEKDYRGVRRGVRDGMIASFLYSVLVVTPVLLLSGSWIADALSETAVTASFSAVALRLVPIACVVGAPFLIIRPVFEAMGRGKPGLVIASIRVLVLSAPFAWAGMQVASRMGEPPVYGLIIGLQLVSLMTSALFFLWIYKVLRSLR